MEDFKKLRDLMVDTQLIPRGIKDERVLSAMRKAPRHIFVDDYMQHKAYDDMALPIGDEQTISQPYMVAVMTELLELKGNEKVLEIGTGSGYQAAILAELSREVFTIERKALLAKKAEERFQALGYINVHVITGDGTLGLPEESPFDRILITAGSPGIPAPLMEQLADGGVIIAPVGIRFSQQLLIVKKSKEGVSEQTHVPCVFVPLIGKHGWPEDEDS
ncbi:MAG: protein-L-isoaspartate O-methyltransferase [Nitrospirae bacterium CG_4_10_14_3_um_filter_44_29]|nr:protein-L-isoaspartate(D-aspartate) O-methyltransferase [Nitrospirota bacterium]OIO28437.1 MAG: protein-L-isoaspartate O-methyltransferase [Nitrospirae bacterium CG1_02_44_142]PIP69413.1 MAG: protein-L-isoaspartate O-methyltransferase [Nitrospirae bacterium CG22_combo_CG10-13_8_21_14_all_44_11]PIV41359.1 MAG: protein-L-isoaspartate O-methyltransferase [Nitrospirae bacterium CG02_land_8_20_14_3_00_44_33]PIV65501.1 MAG: protein-L-isoaspartate O-methyltransferase [Nitrospirae bacterium CG01_lan